ncbi:acyl carrier protein (plasmid) [Clostridium perfringens]|uniref:acyl carrier protein n=1 Tax=Clostridium perfringens TaxID=1502 RepID=UPI000B3708BC|nr:phosphopantetheine-binding protein [Clostridium perfringens]EGT0690057.1 hypothetical protein [Clostridium perfringens]EGT0693847.1 hypothetical protein [Clostridium perfringens]EGT0697093.1 hypothetical protein [Clostridium perfringens]MDU3376242.1 phosphopantetheine-binding protein [Clostridium perfringens]MDU3534198.1 phosphopantetheine-binding protein [Clostridium perfringens]
MNKKEILVEVQNIFKKLGVDYEEFSVLTNNPELDSLMLMSIIVELEVTFDIEIPEEYLNEDFFLSLDNIVDNIFNIMNCQNNED